MFEKTFEKTFEELAKSFKVAEHPPTPKTPPPQKYAAPTDDGWVGFYSDDVHTPEQIPKDAIPISDDEWVSLVQGQSEFKRLAWVNGRPALVDRVKTVEELTYKANYKRDELLSKSDYIVARHRDQVDEGVATTLSEAKYKEWLTYRRLLRDISQQPGYPAKVNWPTEPDSK